MQKEWDGSEMIKETKGNKRFLEKGASEVFAPMRN